MSVPKYWTWTKTTPKKKRLFCSNPYKFEVMITSLIEILDLANCSHIITFIIWFKSRNKNLLVMSLTEIMKSWPLFQNTFILRRPRVTIFSEIIKIVTRFIKTFFKESKKVKRIRNYLPKCNLISVFLDIAKLAGFWWKNANVRRTQVLCHVIHTIFGSSLRQTCPNTNFFSGPYIPAFGLSTEIYGVNLCIHFKHRKIWSRKNSIFG